jgi:hypothetical protein
MSRSAAFLLLLFAGTAAARDDATKLRPIRYGELGKVVRSHKGKPVVVYFWAHY